MVIFIEDDDAYLQWVDQHPEGYVVNAQRRPTSEYLRLHRATCSYISSEARENWTTKQYIKICSLDLDQLTAWAKRDVGGELKGTCYCCRPSAQVAQQAIVRQVELPNVVSQVSIDWKLWRQCEQLIVVEELSPLKASWEKSSDPSQVRLREYRQQIRQALLPHLDRDQLCLHLHVGMPESANLLKHNDLENYLTPLFECGCLPANQFRLVSAEKALGEKSYLVLGIAEQDSRSREPNDCCHISICPTAKFSNDTELKSELRSSLANCGHPALLDGEVEMHVAWRCALGRRSWFRYWKSTGDAMGPILGEYERKNEFDPRDDRITKLSLQLIPDESMGDRAEIGMWWRLLESSPAS